MKINPHWGDERLYQEGRRIMGAVFQHITYNEFLPRIIGLNAMNLYDLRVRTEGYSNDYDPTCNPSMFNEFATAAFRYEVNLYRNQTEDSTTFIFFSQFQIWSFPDPTDVNTNVR